ncbi:hypothetical protein NX059_008093 [Plenodomus lindquistii]|nr:hypothetical protein NX059_008093 [Plenodomus lindquistii]
MPSTYKDFSIPTAEYYQRYVNKEASSDPSEFTLWGEPWYRSYSLDTAMRAAIYTGLYSRVTNTSTELTMCPGSNCTFPRYTTLAVCHKCADISSSITTECHDAPTSNDENATDTQCTYSLPNGQYLLTQTPRYRLYDYKDPTVPIQNWATINSTTRTQILPHIPGTFTNISILANVSSTLGCTMQSKACHSGNIGYISDPFTTLAAECSLFPCTRTYTASVVNNRIHETEVKRSFGSDPWMHFLRSDDIPEPFELVIDPRENCTRRSSTWSGMDDSIGGPCTYAAPPEFTNAAARFFWDFWNGTVSGRTFLKDVPSTEAANVLYNWGDTNFTYVDDTMGAIADAMTAIVRKDGEIGEREPYDTWGGQGPVKGEVFESYLCVGVRWGWIGLPGAVVGLSVLLLLLGMVSSWRHGGGLWKASSLPVLFHGLDAESQSSVQVVTLSEMQREAKNLRVMLRGDDEGVSRLYSTT